MLHGVFSAAGDAFCRAASVQLKCGSKHEAATQYVDASTCYKKADPAGNAVSLCSSFHIIFCALTIAFLAKVYWNLGFSVLLFVCILISVTG